MSQSKIYVGNLSYGVTEADLDSFFSQYGDIEEVKLIKDRETNRSKGFAFITFVSSEAAEASLAAHDAELQDRPLRVSIAKATTGGDRDRGGRGGQGGRGGFSGGRGGQGGRGGFGGGKRH